MESPGSVFKPQCQHPLAEQVRGEWDFGVSAAVLPTPCTGVSYREPAKAIRTFVPGHQESNADTTHFSK